ncbi:MAG: efflux RND transporter periplasmic adaptor subunit [Treponemataceae bacterium]|nr:efflux RND transporter periplasmic adaptor subunit [Spirochaetales bacterium]MDY6030829.1 efflux RND transporter periplasmic adaptor subunit [Treponemataceae bacterium]
MKRKLSEIFKERKIKITPEVIVKIVMVALIVLFILISAISKFAGKKGSAGANFGKGSQNQGEAAITVSAKQIERETIQNTVKLTGNVSSVSEISIYPDTSGKITSIVKNLGDFVSKGETIAFIDPSKPGSAYVASPVKAAISGTIIDLPVSLGDTVSNSTSIATVGSLSDLQLKVYVAEKYSAYLKEGMSAYVSVSSIPNEKFMATAMKISPVVNKSNRTIEVDLKFARYDKRIKPGMFASVELVIQEEKNTFVVPKDCISNFNGKETVLVINADGIAERAEIETGIGNDLDVQVKDGLKEGDKVIIAGSATAGSVVRIAGEHSGDNQSSDEKSSDNQSTGEKSSDNQSSGEKSSDNQSSGELKTESED